jgi:acyl carrier protein
LQLKQDIKHRLNEVFRAVFDDDTLEISDAMTAHDVDGWDSLTHITLVVAVEKEFGLRLPAAEVGKLASVADLVAMVEARVAR